MHALTSSVETPPRRHVPETIDDLCTRPSLAEGWVWQGFLASGNVTLLTSQWKAGKTTLLSVLLARMGSGGELAGLGVRAGRAIVVSEEAPQHWKSRRDRLHFGPHLRFLLRPFRGRPTLAEWQHLIDEIATLPDGPPPTCSWSTRWRAFFPAARRMSRLACSPCSNQCSNC